MAENKRYSDDSLAKWYYSRDLYDNERFEQKLEEFFKKSFETKINDVLKEITDLKFSFDTKIDELAEDTSRYLNQDKEMIEKLNKRVELLEEISTKQYELITFLLQDNDRKKYQRQLEKENEQLKKQLKCSREEADDYCEELMGKDEFVRLYKRQRDDALKENKQLQQELFKSQVDYYAETYHDNPIRAEDKINSLKKEFKERFGKEFKYD